MGKRQGNITLKAGISKRKTYLDGLFTCFRVDARVLTCSGDGGVGVAWMEKAVDEGEDEVSSRRYGAKRGEVRWEGERY